MNRFRRWWRSRGDWWLWLLCGAAVLSLPSCAGVPAGQPAADITEAELQSRLAAQSMTDDRGRFREIFCAVLEARRDEQPDYRPCGEALRQVGREMGATGAPVYLGATRANLLVLVVPGLGWNCFEDWLDTGGYGIAHVAQFGYEVRLVPVDGLSSSENNARMIRDYVAGLPAEDAGRPIVFLGYSKGVPDILEALTAYPDVARRAAAVVSVAGSVRGSPLADVASQERANMMTLVPGSKCAKEHGDNAAVNSLKPAVRDAWLARHPLPPDIRYYSVVTFPEAERISWILDNSYVLLGKTDLRNDTQVTVFDQFVPGSRLVAIANADHWAIAVPVARNHPVVGGTVVNHNDYPRESFLEALLRYVEADLRSGAS